MVISFIKKIWKTCSGTCHSMDSQQNNSMKNNKILSLVVLELIKKTKQMSVLKGSLVRLK